MSCNKSGTDESEKIFLNFYLPGIWRADPFDAESVAHFLADRHPDGPDVRVEGSFQAPDPQSHQQQFVLFLSAVVAEQGYGQAVMVKVAPLRGAVYSLIYSRVLQGPARTMRATITGWFGEHLDTYGNELFALRPDESWIDYVKGRVNGKAPTPKCDVSDPRQPQGCDFLTEACVDGGCQKCGPGTIPLRDRCTKRCASDRDCPSDTICVFQTHSESLCLRPQPKKTCPRGQIWLASDGECWTTCKTDRDCPEDLHCRRDPNSPTTAICMGR